MHRLGQYMIDFANLLGEAASVHFDKMEKGSAVLKAWSEQTASVKIEERIRLVKTDNAPPEAMEAFHAINKKMKEDNTDGLILEDRKKIIDFLGIKIPVAQIFGPITQNGTIEGVVIGVGGKNKTASIRILAYDNEEITCKAVQQLVKQLGHYLYEKKVRLVGTGKWIRNENGKWVLEAFTATDYEILKDESLIETVYDLRHVTGSEWTNLENPWKELNNIRGEEQ